jgi:hypothetical protein
MGRTRKSESFLRSETKCRDLWFNLGCFNIREKATRLMVTMTERGEITIEGENNPFGV